jgi:hypothetical protein
MFADILVGVPGLINTAITNLSVVMLTGIAGQLGREAAIGYAMGARLEYVLQPLAFGFGTAIVAMVGINWGAGQYRGAREIAWTGAAIVSALCGAIGLIVAFYPTLWMSLLSDDPDVGRIGARLLDDAGEDAGMLPLLQCALKETWALRQGNRMTGVSYARSGGVREAIRIYRGAGLRRTVCRGATCCTSALPSARHPG